MPAIPKLSAQAITEAMLTLDGWELLDGQRIKKRFTFASFGEAFGFMTLLAPVAEEMDHHPEWSNVYNRVTVEMTTHDVGGLSEYDFIFARKADELAALSS